MNVTFVILHYITIDDTIECIKSIVNNVKYNNYNIVVVDNASPNGSGEELKRIYNGIPNIFVLSNNQNLGFAKGNNVGFKFAKNQLKADFIVMINNDTIIEQNNFCDLINEFYRTEKFYILGPNIESLYDNGHQNPYKESIATKGKVIKTLINQSLKLILNYICIDRLLLTINKKIYNKKHNSNKINTNYTKKSYKGVLHGSCLIFSPKYIEKFNGLYNGTFMYGEEDILFYICSKLKLKYIYLPELTIYHKEESSTKESLGNKTSKQSRFFYKNKLNSTYKLLKIMIRNDNLEKLLE